VSVAAKRSNNRASRPADRSTVRAFRRPCHFAERLRFFLILAMLEIDLRREESATLGLIASEPAAAPTKREARLAVFIALKRPGPPAREVLVNLDNILMVQPGQGSGSAILFGREHLISFEEDVATVLRRIQTGPYIRTDEA
jgi:hypothetical protein